MLVSTLLSTQKKVYFFLGRKKDIAQTKMTDQAVNQVATRRVIHLAEMTDNVTSRDYQMYSVNTNGLNLFTIRSHIIEMNKLVDDNDVDGDAMKVYFNWGVITASY